MGMGQSHKALYDIIWQQKGQIEMYLYIPEFSLLSLLLPLRFWLGRTTVAETKPPLNCRNCRWYFEGMYGDMMFPSKLISSSHFALSSPLGWPLPTVNTSDILRFSFFRARTCVLLQKTFDCKSRLYLIGTQHWPFNISERDPSWLSADAAHKIFAHASIENCRVQRCTPAICKRIVELCSKMHVGMDLWHHAK